MSLSVLFSVRIIRSVARSFISIHISWIFLKNPNRRALNAAVPVLSAGKNLAKSAMRTKFVDAHREWDATPLENSVFVSLIVFACCEQNNFKLFAASFTDVEGFTIPVWVIRQGQRTLEYTESLSRPQNPNHQQFVTQFNGGTRETYRATPLAPNFIFSEVNDILNPHAINSTWDDGILFNFTVRQSICICKSTVTLQAYFIRGRVQNPIDVWSNFVDACRQNNFQIGNSGLYINPYQQNPFSACFKSDCHPKARCITRGPNSYTCECPKDYVDLDPSYRGRKCRPKFGYNECANPRDNECGDNSR